MRYLFIFISVSTFFACQQKSQDGADPIPINNIDSLTKQEENFFPVTVYFKGQIHDIIEKGINPLKIIPLNGKYDSTWLKVEALNKEFADFLTPVIDTVNMKPWFTESKFLDNTIEAFTWTYDAKPNIPDSINLRNWTVYVNPNSGKVTSIYMKKILPDSKQLQLTWYADSCTHAITVGEKNGKAVILNQTTILWDFNP